MNDPVFALMGIAIRAGKVESGEAAVRKAIMRGKVSLLLIATDVSTRTLQHFQEMAQENNLPVRRYGTKLQWGMVLGKRPRGLVGIIDRGFAQNFLNKLEEMNM